MRWLHPMRTTRYMWSQWLNPAMAGVAALAPVIRQSRLRATPGHFLFVIVQLPLYRSNQALDIFKKHWTFGR